MEKRRNAPSSARSRVLNSNSKANRSRKKQLLGAVAVFLLPSQKMKSRSPRGTTYDDELHHILVENFSGYTVTTGNISGYWKDGAGNEQYGEHREYRIAFSDPDDISALQDYICALAKEIREESVYCEINNQAWLLHSER